MIAVAHLCFELQDARLAKEVARGFMDGTAQICAPHKGRKVTAILLCVPQLKIGKEACREGVQPLLLALKLTTKPNTNTIRGFMNEVTDLGERRYTQKQGKLDYPLLRHLLHVHVS